ALGFVLFALTMAILVSTDRLLLFLGKTVSWTDPLDPSSAKNPPPSSPASPRSRSKLMGLPAGWALAGPVAAAYLVPVLLQAGDYQMGAWVGRVSTVFTGDSMIESYKALADDTLPDKVDKWQRVGASELQSRPVGNAFGLYSRVWRYQAGTGGLTAT